MSGPRIPLAPTLVEPSTQPDELDTAVSRTVDDDDAASTLPGSPPEVPSRVAGRYDLHQLLGGGAMGTVHLATDLTLGRTVAIKLIRSARALDSRPRSRFLREAQALAALSHPAIVPLLDFGIEDQAGLCFTVLRYVEGPSLRAYLNQRGPVDEHSACRILEVLASALAHAHGAGILHRDLKPENVLLEGVSAGRLEPRLTDFGLAKIEDAQPITAMGVRLGTPTSMAPEQVMGGRLDARADLYALGCLIDWLLLGHPPFTDDDPFALYEAHVARPPPPLPPRLVDGRPPSSAVQKLRASLLAKAKEDRPPNAVEVVRSLQVILRSNGPGQRRRVIRWGLLAAGLLASAAIGVSLLRKEPPPTLPSPSGAEPVAPPVEVRPLASPVEAPTKVARPPPPLPSPRVPKRRAPEASPRPHRDPAEDQAPAPVPSAPPPPSESPLMPLW